MGLILRLMEPFLQYLDNYKTVDADFMDINNLIYVINQDYYKNKYFLPFYVGDSKIYKKNWGFLRKYLLCFSKDIGFL